MVTTVFGRMGLRQEERLSVYSIIVYVAAPNRPPAISLHSCNTRKLAVGGGVHSECMAVVYCVARVYSFMCMCHMLIVVKDLRDWLSW